jgi:hypothetical protein
MNAAYSQFANSPHAGALVTAAVVFFTFAALTAIWVVDLVREIRRDARARELREQRARRQSGVVAATGAIRNDAKPLAFRKRATVAESEGERRLKAIGIDDGFHAWVEGQRR